MKYPKITVVTVCYNAAAEIASTMRSVLNQSYDNLEYILVDGASKDDTLDIIQKVCAEFPSADITVRSEPDNGIFDAMNKGIELATGDWINFMNAGDMFADANVVRDFFHIADLTPPNDIIYGDTILKYPFGCYYKDCKPKHAANITWCHQSLFARVSLMKRMRFNVRYKYNADHNFIVQSQKQGRRLVYFPRVVACYKDYDGFSTLNTCKRTIDTYEIEGWPKDWRYYYLVVRNFIQSTFHIRSFRGNLEARKLQSVEANTRLRRIADVVPWW